MKKSIIWPFLSKALISINKSHIAFQLTNYPIAVGNYQVIEIHNGVIVCHISGSKITGEEWQDIYLIFSNGTEKEYVFSNAICQAYIEANSISESNAFSFTGEYTVGFANGNEFNVGDKVSDSVTIGNYSVLVLYK